MQTLVGCLGNDGTMSRAAWVLLIQPTDAVHAGKVGSSSRVVVHATVERFRRVLPEVGTQDLRQGRGIQRL